MISTIHYQHSDSACEELPAEVFPVRFLQSKLFKLLVVILELGAVLEQFLLIGQLAPQNLLTFALVGDREDKQQDESLIAKRLFHELLEHGHQVFGNHVVARGHIQSMILPHLLDALFTAYQLFVILMSLCGARPPFAVKIRFTANSIVVNILKCSNICTFTIRILRWPFVMVPQFV